MKISFTPAGRLTGLQEVLQPDSIADAVALRHDARGQGAFFACGSGFALGEVTCPDFAVDLGRLGLSGVEVSKTGLHIGATTPLQEVLEAPGLRQASPALLQQALEGVRQPISRRQSSMAGALFHGLHAAPLRAALLALDASVRVVEADDRSGPNSRPIPLSRALEDLDTAGHPLALWEKIEIPNPESSWCFSLQQLRRTHLDRSLGGVAVALRRQSREITAARLFMFDFCGERLEVQHAPRTVEALVTTKPDAGRWDRVLKVAVEEIEVRGDFRATESYRRHLLQVLLGRSLRRALENRGGNR